MAIFNPGSAKKDAPSFAPDAARRDAPPAAAEFSPTQTEPPRAQASAPQVKESLIAADLTIEGKIEGSGHVRIAGRFKGDVNVKGDLTVERGAKLNGGVRAEKVIVAGELEGNIESAERVELLDSSALSGDVKAGTLTVAAGARIRGHVECGWTDAAPAGGDRPGKESRGDAKPAEKGGKADATS